MNYVLFLLILCAFGSPAQTVHELPFASHNNILEFAIENSASLSLEKVIVTATDAPSWLRMEPQSKLIGHIRGNTSAPTRFFLSVDKSAPVGQEHRLSLTVSAGSGMSWKKDVLISVAPPASFELLQNFPNPFNPSTTIAYQLPAESNVSVKVFDLLGREVAVLANRKQPAGHHTVSWDGSRQASGMYVYEMVADAPNRKQTVFRRTMMLVK